MPTVTGHAWLAGDTSWDDNDLSALQASSEALGSGLIAGDLFIVQPLKLVSLPSIHLTLLLVLMWPTSAATPGPPLIS